MWLLRLRWALVSFSKGTLSGLCMGPTSVTTGLLALLQSSQMPISQCKILGNVLKDLQVPFSQVPQMKDVRNGRGSSLQSFFPGQDHPVEASTALPACLAAGYLVRSLTFTLACYHMECLG